MTTTEESEHEFRELADQSAKRAALQLHIYELEAKFTFIPSRREHLEVVLIPYWKRRLDFFRKCASGEITEEQQRKLAGLPPL